MALLSQVLSLVSTGIFTSGLFGDGSVSNPSITFSNDLDVGLYRPGDNQLGITVGSTNAILINGSELTISGATNANSITATGAIISRSLQVSGDATVTGNLDVSGNTYVRGNLEASGNTTLSGTLTVSGAISGVTDGGVYGSGYWKIPAGAEGARPAGAAALSGMIRYNTTIDQYEGFGGGGAGAWSSLGGGATGSGGDRVFVLNETGVTTDYTLSGFNASSAGPITIEDGIDVIIADDFNWSIV